MEGMINEMEPLSLYKKNYKIESDHVDFKGRLKLSSLFIYFQDIAGLHAENLGLGMDFLHRKHNALWVLARMRVDMIRYPLWNEQITIDTWPNGPGKIEFTRNFIVKDEDKNILAKAVSTWVIIDVESRKLQKAKSVYTGYPSIIEERAINCKLGNLKSQGPLEIAYNRTVGYSDIDINRHLNNSKYIDFIMDCFTLKEHEEYSIKSIEINYSKEALPEDTISIYKDISQIHSNIIYIEGVNKRNGELSFKAQLSLETNDSAL